jgi:hypothetical protein
LVDLRDLTLIALDQSFDGLDSSGQPLVVYLWVNYEY